MTAGRPLALRRVSAADAMLAPPRRWPQGGVVLRRAGDVPAAAPRLRLTASLDGAAVRADIADDRLLARAQRRAPGFDPADIAEPDLRALALEAALMEEIEAIEDLLGAELRLLSVAPQELALFGAWEDAAPAGARLRAQDENGAALADIWADPALAERIWRSLPCAADASETGRRAEERIGLVLAARIGASTVTTGALRRIAPGDALRVASAAPSGRAAAVLNERMVAGASFRGDQGAELVIQSRFERAALGAATVLLEPSPAAQSHERGAHMSETQTERADAKTVGDALDARELDALPVRLVFEAGRAELTVAELKRLSVGGVVPLERSAEPKVVVYANGRRFASGELIELDGRLAVEIDTLGDGA